MDVKTTFLNGYLEAEIYVEQSEDYKNQKDEKNLQIKEGIVWTKMSPLAWNICLDNYLQQNGFSKCPFEYATYVKKQRVDILIVCVYVDDISIIALGSEEMI